MDPSSGSARTAITHLDPCQLHTRHQSHPSAREQLELPVVVPVMSSGSRPWVQRGTGVYQRAKPSLNERWAAKRVQAEARTARSTYCYASKVHISRFELCKQVHKSILGELRPRQIYRQHCVLAIAVQDNAQRRRSLRSHDKQSVRNAGRLVCQQDLSLEQLCAVEALGSSTSYAGQSRGRFESQSSKILSLPRVICISRFVNQVFRVSQLGASFRDALV